MHKLEQVQLLKQYASVGLYLKGTSHLPKLFETDEKPFKSVNDEESLIVSEKSVIMDPTPPEGLAAGLFVEKDNSGEVVDEDVVDLENRPATVEIVRKF